MNSQIEDRHITRVRPLVTPAVLSEELVAREEDFLLVEKSRRAIEDILDGKDKRCIIIVGPCSIHDPAAALDYARKLKAQVDLYPNLLIVMRVYFEKPRTVVGWKGLINDPDIDNSFNINKGLRLARQLLLDITEIGLPCGTEFLDTTFGQYYADLITWGAIGARTAESQIHRELASGLSMPVGIKNRTDGNLQVAVDGIRAAAHRHLFPSLTKEGAPAIFETGGNKYCHLILRGGDQTGPNYQSEDLEIASKLLEKNELTDALIVDCSHGNSQKDPQNQIKVMNSLCASLRGGYSGLKGVMLESFIEEGRQDFSPENNVPENNVPEKNKLDSLVYGKSITDGCLSLDQTLPLLEEFNQVLENQK